MEHKLKISVGEKNFVPTAQPIKETSLGGEFLGWEFFSNFEERHNQVDFDHVRWPGGIPVEEGINIDKSADGSREKVFDLTFDNFIDWDRDISNGYSHDPVPREGLSEMLEFAAKNDTSFAMVLPTMPYIEMAFDNPAVALKKVRADVRDFMTRLLGDQFGTLPKELIFEIGSEYYALPVWRGNFQDPAVDVAGSMASIFAGMVSEIDRALSDPELNKNSYDINIAVQLARFLSPDDDPNIGFDENGVINGGWGDLSDNTDFIHAFQTAKALDAVDSLIFHRYVPNFWGIERGFTDPVNGGNTLAGAIGEWEAAAGRKLGLVGGHLSPTAQGSLDIEHHTPGLTNILQLTTHLLAQGMDYGTIFALGHRTDGSLGYRETLLIGGQLYELMAKSLPGLHVHDGFQDNTSPVDTTWNDGNVTHEALRQDSSVNKYIFENSDLVVAFLIAKNFNGEVLNYKLEFDEHFEKVDIARLSDTGERVFNTETEELIGHIGEISYEEDLPVEQITSGTEVKLSFKQDYEVVRITLDRKVVDTFQGTDGNDFFRINHEADRILNPGAGIDTAESSIDFSLTHSRSSQYIENLALVGEIDINGVGNSLDNHIKGNNGHNTLKGLQGRDILSGKGGDDVLYGGPDNDSMFGGEGDDTLEGGEGNDFLKGEKGDDTLLGGPGHDRLHGGDGFDILVGGDGSDVFIIDPAHLSGDTIFDFTMGEDIIDLSKTPVRSFDELTIVWATERIFVQDGYGTYFFLEGLDKGDVKLLQESDFIYRGQSFDDSKITPSVDRSNSAPELPENFEGRVLVGTDGDDVFRVSSKDDLIISAGLGSDTVKSFVDFTLRRHSEGDDLENLELLGLEDLTGVGNSLDNILTGNAGDNHLSGVWGDDILYGLDGNDTLLGVVGDDSLYGGPGDDLLEGNSGNDTLNGGSGDDRLVPGEGDDTVSGGPGRDLFVYSGGLDTFTDFDPAQDSLRVTIAGLSVEELSRVIREAVDEDGGVRAHFSDGSIFFEGMTRSDLELINTQSDYLSDQGFSLRVVDRHGVDFKGAKVTFVPKDGGAAVELSDVESISTFLRALPRDTKGKVEVEEAYDPLSDPEIGVADALNVLRMAVGLEPSIGEPDGLDFIAADFDRDGEITVGDALDVLRVSVGLETPHEPEWVFIDTSRDLSHISRENVFYEPGVELDAMSGYRDIELSGVLLGNVFG